MTVNIAVKITSEHRAWDNIGALSVVEVNTTIPDDFTTKVHDMLEDASSRLSVKSGGHVPDDIVFSYIKRLYTSRNSVSVTFASSGRRFCLFDANSQVVSSVLVSKDPALALVFDSNNLNVPILQTGLPARNLHQIFNFTTRYSERRRGYGRALLAWIESHSSLIRLSGDGFWTFVEPPDFRLYQALGFTHRPSGDQFFENNVATASQFNDRFLTPLGFAGPSDCRMQIKCFYMEKDWKAPS